MDSLELKTRLVGIAHSVADLAGLVDVPEVGREAVMTEESKHWGVAPDLEAGNYFIVGEAEGKAGETVHVEVLGQTIHPVAGIGAYIGCEKSLVLTRSEISQTILDLTGLTSMQAGATQNKGAGIEGFIALHLAFFGAIQIETDATDQEAAAEKARLKTQRAVVLPHMTPLMRLTFKIPDDAEPGRVFELDNTPLKYGRYMRSGGTRRTMRLDTVYGTEKGVTPHGIKPTCVSGRVTVVA